MEEGRNPDRNSGWGMWVVEMEFSSGNVGASRQGRGRCLAEGKERRGSPAGMGYDQRSVLKTDKIKSACLC